MIWVGVAGSAFAGLPGPAEAAAAPAPTPNYPLCMNCKHFSPDTRFDDEPDDKYWNHTHMHRQRCRMELPDVVTGRTPVDLSDMNTCWNMRVMGPCGLKGVLFEARDDKPDGTANMSA